MAGTKQKERCDIVLHLMKRGCRADFIESPSAGVTMPASNANVQVAPGEVSIQLRPGLFLKKKVLFKMCVVVFNWTQLLKQQRWSIHTEPGVFFLNEKRYLILENCYRSSF